MVLGQNILQMMRRHFFTKVWSHCVMKLETNHDSLPYNNIDFTHELNIRSFVRLEICGLTHTACILPRAVRGLFSLQLTSSCAPPSIVSSRSFQQTQPGIRPRLFGLRCYGWLSWRDYTSKPTERASILRQSEFACISVSLWERRHMSSAKSRSSRCLVKNLLCRINWLMMSSRTMAKISGGSGHPWLNPACAMNESLILPLCSTVSSEFK